MPASHVLTILAVADLARSASFYDQIFGWTKSVEEPVYVEYELPRGMRLGLYARASFAVNTGTAPMVCSGQGTTASELYFHVEDLAEAERRAADAGARRLSHAALRPWGDIASYLADPDGNVIVLARPAAGTTQHDEAT